jgi:transcriptional regulator with XRE-family HTH domain
MPTAMRALDRGSRLARRHANEVGSEFLERRLMLGQSQGHVAASCQLSRGRYGLIERGRATSLTIMELDRIAAVLGLSPSLRLYPDGTPVRDAGQARRLMRFLERVREPLTYRIEVALPQQGDRTELRAWDAMIGGGGMRTAIELEMRLRDVQALLRRIELKRRDDSTEGFLLLIADTRNNRRLLAEFAGAFIGLPRLRPSAVRAALEAGRHPGTGMVLV